jgi:phosphoribosylglycinamide formyltransferase-1
MTAAASGEAPLRVVVLASGRGSNLRAIAQRADAGQLPVAIAAVISDRPQSAALEWARQRGVPAAALEPEHYPDREAYGAALAQLVDGYAPQLVVLAGFMRILSNGFVTRFAGRLLNIHPSLLPKYPGLHTHRRALAAGDAEHGASVHFVTAELDGGPVVIQARVPVRPGDDEAALAARVLRLEHEIYPRCIGWFASGRLVVRDGQPWLDGRPLAQPVLYRAECAEEQRT